MQKRKTKQKTARKIRAVSFWVLLFASGGLQPRIDQRQQHFFAVFESEIKHISHFFVHVFNVGDVVDFGCDQFSNFGEQFFHKNSPWVFF